MKLYFYTSELTADPIINVIKVYFTKVGIDFVFNLEDHGVVVDESTEARHVDGIIIYGDLDSRASYLLASYLAQGIDVIFLSKLGKKFDEVLLNFRNNPAFKGKLSLETVSGDNVIEKLKGFLRNVDRSDLNDKANIKFTLRLSRRLSDYLDWRAKNKKVKKADDIRDELIKIMMADKHYGDFIEKKY